MIHLQAVEGGLGETDHACPDNWQDPRHHCKLVDTGVKRQPALYVRNFAMNPLVINSTS